jgi:hypothetical protein
MTTDIRNKTFSIAFNTVKKSTKKYEIKIFFSANSEVKAFNGYIGLPDTDLPYRTQGSWCWQNENDQGEAHND